MIEVEKVFIHYQTELIERLLDNDFIDLDYSDIVWDSYNDLMVEPEELADEYYEDPAIYDWMLVSQWYRDVVEKIGLPYIQYKGDMWVGIVFGNVAIENTCYWEKLLELLNIDKSVDLDDSDSDSDSDIESDIESDSDTNNDVIVI